MMLIALVVNVAQVGFKPTAKKLKPDFSRLNPFKGFKRMVGTQAWWELGKSVARPRCSSSSRGRPCTTRSRTLTSGNERVAVRHRRRHRADRADDAAQRRRSPVSSIAAADYAFQKRRVMKQLQMTRQEAARGNEAARRKPAR